MPQRRARPVRFAPKGCSDAVDGSSAFPGAMAQLANLAPDPAMNGSFVPRPGAYLDIDFAALGYTTPAFISSSLVIGNLCYGTIASGLNAGNDEPFCVDLLMRSAIAVSGITAGNTPASPPPSGAWTPPIIAQVGSRVVVTHPGFPGGAVKFGWFDVSGFTETVTADLTMGTPTISGNPLVDGVQPGMTVTGGGIPAGATVMLDGKFCADRSRDAQWHDGSNGTGFDRGRGDRSGGRGRGHPDRHDCCRRGVPVGDAQPRGDRNRNLDHYVFGLDDHDERQRARIRVIRPDDRGRDDGGASVGCGRYRSQSAALGPGRAWRNSTAGPTTRSGWMASCSVTAALPAGCRTSPSFRPSPPTTAWR